MSRVPYPPLPLAPESPYGGEDLPEGDVLGEHLGGSRPYHLLVDRGVLQCGHHQNRDGWVGPMEILDHLRSSLVGEGYVHYGGVYATLGHPLASLDHGAGLGRHLEVGLLIHHVGGGLAEGAVVLDENHEACGGHFRRSACSRTYERPLEANFSERRKGEVRRLLHFHTLG